MSPTPSFDVSANHRTKEENQERAFIAASRRKDRSLDARIESANRASALHKNRTGRALHITRSIVENEAMYEEVDSNYQVKLQRMMQAQTMQLEQDFERKLFVAMRNNPQALHQRRASSLASQGPMHGARRMSIDLSQLRTTLPETMTSPLTSSHFSPRWSIAPTGPHIQTQTHAQVPSYVASGTPTWMRPEQQQQLMQHWDGLYSNPISPSAIGGLPMPTQPFRDRLASAPSIPVQAQAANIPATPPGSRGSSQHIRVRSEPGTTNKPASTPPSASSSSSSSSFQVGIAPCTSSPGLDQSSSSDILPTPDPCASPHTPASQASEPNSCPGLDLANIGAGPEKWSADLLHELDLNLGFEAFSHEPADQDYLDFSQFASTIENGHFAHSQAHAHMQIPMQMPVQLDLCCATESSMDELPDMDEYTVTS
ncbi:hypothetical protein BJX65DRAFT_280739 [Aspergillus insuetus]